MNSKQDEVHERFHSINDAIPMEETNNKHEKQYEQIHSIKSTIKSRTQTRGEEEMDDMVRFMRQVRESHQSSLLKSKGKSSHLNKSIFEYEHPTQNIEEEFENGDSKENGEEEPFENNADQLTDTQSFTVDSDYFKQDSADFDDLLNQVGNVNLNFQDTNNYYASWSWSQFFEFFFYHLVFYFLGPFCFIVFLPFRGGINIYRNLGFNFGGDFSFIQTMLWLTYSAMTILYFTVSETQKFVELFEIYTMWIMIIFRIFSIACKYAMLHPLTIMCYKARILTKEEKLRDFYLANWKQQTESCLIEELYSAQQRNEIDLTLFSTHFFDDINQTTYNRLIELQQQQLHSIQFSQLSKAFLGKNAEKVVEQISQLAQEDNYTSRKTQFFNGMAILHHLIDQFNATHKNYKKNYVVFIFAFLRSIIWFVYILCTGPHLFLEFGWFESVIGSFMVLFNFILYSAIGFFLSGVLCDSHRINYLMVQMLFLIKPRKDQNYLDTRKILPTLNLTCSNNFKNWIQLRKLSIEYGKRFWKRGQANLSFMLVYSFYPIISIILHLLDVFAFNNLQIFYMAYDFMLISFCVSACLYFSACINYSFVYHIQVLEEIRIVFRNLLREDLLQHKNELSSFLYRIILKKLRIKAQNDNEAIQESILQIIDSIEDSKNELQLQQSTEPFQCFGFTITFSILKSSLLFIFSILTFSINIYLKTH